MVTYTVNSDETEFDFVIHGTGMSSGEYVAMGLSMDKSMGSDLVVHCIEGKTVLKTSWNKDSGKDNEPDATGLTMSNQDVSTENGVLSCKFSVPATFTITPPASGASDVNFDLSANSYHLLVARGNVRDGSENVAYHNVDRQGSDEPISLKSFAKVAPTSNALVKAHGIIMLIAWMACAATGEIRGRNIGLGKTF